MDARRLLAAQSQPRLPLQERGQSGCQVALGSLKWETLFSARIDFALSLFQSVDQEPNLIAKIDLNES